MYKRRTWTGQILDASKHIVFLCSSSHEERLALSLASLERYSRVAHLARQHQLVESRQRLVNHDRPQLRSFVHCILSVLRQISCSGLLDISNSFETLRCLLLQTTQSFQQIAYVRASFVEVERIHPRFLPSLHLDFGRRTIDLHDAIEVPRQLSTIQFDLDVRQAVVTNPFRQGF